MIDLHCHILPGIDDGPADINISIEMARIAAADGITTIVATPHVKERMHPASEIGERIAELNERLDALNIPVRILPGADVYALLDPALLHPYTINNTDYILIEFPHSHLPKNAKEVLFRLIMAGFLPIITHPERNPSIIRNPELLFDLLGSGALVQITADSLAGTFGPEKQACARYLLQHDVVQFIATDAHSSQYRRPILSAGLKNATKIIGKEKAQRLVSLYPEAVISGRPVPA